MKFNWHIRTQLAALIFSLVIPLAGLFAYSIYTHINDDLEDAGKTALSLARITATDTAEYIHSRQNTLARIAERNLIRKMDPDQCDPILLDYRSFDASFSNIVIMDRNGGVICSALPIDRRISYGKGRNFTRVNNENRFVVGYPSFGRISDKWILPLAYPVHDTDKKIIGVIGAAIDLVQYSPISAQSSLPHNAEVMLVTDDGTILSRSRQPEVWVGRNIGKTGIMQTIQENRNGTSIMRGLDNEKMVFGYSPIAMTNWYALIGIPTSSVLDNSHATAWRDGILGLLITLTTILLGLLIIRRIEKPIRSIADAARRVADGDLNTRLNIGGSVEIANVAEQFNLMLDNRQEAERSIREYSEHLRLTMESVLIGTWQLNLPDHSITCSENTLAMFGIRNKNLVKTMEEAGEIIHPNDRNIVRAAIEKTLETAALFESEFRVVWPDKSIHWVAGKGRLFHDENGNPDYITGIVMDITERMLADEQMRFLATHDALTNLVNRREFESRLEQALKRARSRNNQYAVLYMDLDQFKVVNDTCGHFAGDELLRQLANVLQGRVRETDTIARLGGDEFGILLENCPLSDARKLAEEIRTSVQDFRFVWEERAFTIGVSIGLVSIHDNSHNPQQVMSAADAACFIAKDKGRNRVHIHEPDDSAQAQHLGEMEWVSRINKAFEESRFCLYYQTIEPLQKHEPGIHCELLVRMIGSDGDIIPPMAFIPAAERFGLMSAIDRWVIQTAFRFLTKNRHMKEQAQLRICTINISATSLNDEKFLDFVREQFMTYAVPADTICFEVTETAAIANLTQARHFIRELKSLGCRFALDDFGSGMSSFAYLKNLDVDFLKIDGGFVQDMLRDPIDRAMVQSINNIGQVMGIKTIAEFVENDETVSLLRSFGVNYGQGHGLSKPAPLEELGNNRPRLSIVKTLN